MKIARALPMILCVALAACGGAPVSNSVNAANAMSNELLDPAKEMARRWGTVFSDAELRVRAAKEMGYTIGALTAGAPGTFSAKSDEQVIQLPRSPIKTRSTLEASGTKADLVDRYVFTFTATGDDGRDNKSASDADKTPLRVLSGFLGRFDVQPTDPIKAGIKSLQPVDVSLPGARIVFDPGPVADPKHPRNRSSMITVIRPGAKNPTTPQDQTVPAPAAPVQAAKDKATRK
ncbi:hypothetical protein DBR17_05755 [Sphingomonas sp. HMWF008]|nr:hypothetical protein DBR17_05755 [Sphingomonas sp. HMWF008]